MPRKLLIRSTTEPYHVTARANNREPFLLEPNKLWNLMNEQLAEICEKHGVNIHAFVLMSNHFHLLISTPKDDLGLAMQTFMRAVTKIHNAKLLRTGRVFGSKYHWSIVNSVQHLDLVLKYIYRNPVRAGIAKKIEDYPFSSFCAVLDDEQLPYKLSPPVGQTGLIPEDGLQNYLEWLNKPFANEDEAEVRFSLKRSTFQGARRGYKMEKTAFAQSMYAAAGLHK